MVERLLTFTNGVNTCSIKIFNNELHIKSELTNGWYLKLTPDTVLKVTRNREEAAKWKLTLAKLKTVSEQDQEVYVVFEMAKKGYQCLEAKKVLEDAN
jgi:uncharacterized protein YecE (DUF72 family)